MSFAVKSLCLALGLALSGCEVSDHFPSNQKSTSEPMGANGRVTLKQPTLANEKDLGLRSVISGDDDEHGECGTDGSYGDGGGEAYFDDVIDVNLTSLDDDYGMGASEPYQAGSEISIDEVPEGTYELIVRLHAYGESYEGSATVTIYAYSTTFAQIVLRRVQGDSGNLNVEILVDEESECDDGCWGGGDDLVVDDLDVIDTCALSNCGR